jgi:hypothetical protein
LELGYDTVSIIVLLSPVNTGVYCVGAIPQVGSEK